MAPAITCNCGECKKCKRRAYMRAYYRRPGVTERWKASVAKSRERRLENIKAYDRERRKHVDPAKDRARKLLAQKIRFGRMERQPCEICGGSAQAHHEDYSKPYEVRWLCRVHHMELHRMEA